MQMALRHRLAHESDMDQRERVNFISDEFKEDVSLTNINVNYKRAFHISERSTSHHHTSIDPYFSTTTLLFYYNYTGNRCIR